MNNVIDSKMKDKALVRHSTLSEHGTGGEDTSKWIERLTDCSTSRKGAISG